MEKMDLEAMIQEGLSIRTMAARSGKAPATIRKWLMRYDLRTIRAERLQRTAPSLPRGARTELQCPRHGRTTFQRRPDGGWRCLRCRADAVADRRRKVKEILVFEAGGSCVLCGFDRHVSALGFHHLEPATKRFSVSQDGVTRSLERAREEARKCVLLCANCHAMVEAGVAILP